MIAEPEPRQPFQPELLSTTDRTSQVSEPKLECVQSPSGCAASMRPLQASGPSPLVVASCQELTPLGDDTFGATTGMLVEVANQYWDCREAALAK
jgi:hypothetical protein